MSKYDFFYLIKKIESYDFEYEPFKHIYIEDFFSKEHFKEIIRSSEIALPKAANDKELIDSLLENGFKQIPFPGCIEDVSEYINWHQRGKGAPRHTACEGFGMTFRLFKFSTLILRELNNFLLSKEFNQVIAKKFNIVYENCLVDGGIQKYLDGYEISPHPDVRKKAATFMVNINQSNESEKQNHHTHYLKLKKTHKYIQEFWEGNKNIDRSWLPWNWAKTIKQQKKNNSIVLFSPSNDTLHGIKADYDHLQFQRTQLYGNLWYKESSIDKVLEWEDLDLSRKATDRKLIANQKINRLLNIH